MNDAKTDALLITIGKLDAAVKYMRRTHDYDAFVPIDRECEGCAIILGLEEARGKCQHALKGGQ